MAVLKVSLFCDWTNLKIKRDILAEHILCTVPAQKEILAVFCHKCNYVMSGCLF